MEMQEDSFEVKRHKMFESVLRYCEKQGIEVAVRKVYFPDNGISGFLKEYRLLQKQARENMKKDKTLYAV